MALFGPKPKPGAADELHRLISEHWTAEYCVKTQGNGRSVQEWKARPGGPDNDFFDCLVGAAVAASMLGCVAGTSGKPLPAKKKVRKRAKVSYLS